MPHTYISRLLVNLKDTAATFTKFLFVQSGLIGQQQQWQWCASIGTAAVEISCWLTWSHFENNGFSRLLYGKQAKLKYLYEIVSAITVKQMKNPIYMRNQSRSPFEMWRSPTKPYIRFRDKNNRWNYRNFEADWKSYDLTLKWKKFSTTLL